MADTWLDLAPKPGPLPAGKQWHVFLSYRSVNRPWVLALYDVLNVLGYKVFLDQYVLTAAAPLAWRGRGLCTGRERGEGTSSRAPELCIAVSASPPGGAVVEAASGRTG
jgi:hypothetical protein